MWSFRAGEIADWHYSRKWKVKSDPGGKGGWRRGAQGEDVVLKSLVSQRLRCSQSLPRCCAPGPRSGVNQGRTGFFLRHQHSVPKVAHNSCPLYPVQHLADWSQKESRFRTLCAKGHTSMTLCPGLGYVVSGFQSPRFFHIEPHRRCYLINQFGCLSKTSSKMEDVLLMARTQIIWAKRPNAQTKVGWNQMCWRADFHNSPMKWLCPKASISSKRTRPPGAWRRVTLRPSMREHCWNPVAVTFHSRISEAAASCRILKTGVK